MTENTRTFLAFQHNAELHTIDVIVTAVRPFSALEESNRQLFKTGRDSDHVIVTKQTIFHPQGGGQPSDVGLMTGPNGGSFIVTAVRMDAVCEGQVLHLGRFSCGEDYSASIFNQGETVAQTIDVEKRLLYSRLHTAGHVLGASVRHLVKSEIKNFAELKASHFPGAACCEFQGLIDGKWKDAIQKKVDESIAAKLPVSIEWWDAEDFQTKGLDYLLPNSDIIAPGEKFRMVSIAGLDTYPCGGTHVITTDLCGQTTVKKISRKTGQSKVSYSVA
jgi:Ser-tRNA(Ala) deacylase AlaX